MTLLHHVQQELQLDQSSLQNLLSAETDKNIEKQGSSRHTPMLKNLTKMDMNRKEMKHMLIMMTK